VRERSTGGPAHPGSGATAHGESDLLARTLWHAPNPHATTSGPSHMLVYANAAFQRLAGDTGLGKPLGDLLSPETSQRLVPLLDRAYENMISLDGRLVGRMGRSRSYWNCRIWPILRSDGRAEGLGMELHKAAHQQRSAALQREVAERLLISALREAEAADKAEAGHSRAVLLADAGRRLRGLGDEATTRASIAGSVPAILGTWCIVDVFEGDGTTARAAMIHPEPEKQRLLHELSILWEPQPDDQFGAEAVWRAAGPVAISDHFAEALAGRSHTPDQLRLLKAVGIGPLLSVPLVHEGRVLGAITFVRDERQGAFSPEEIELAEGIAAHSASALDGARKYGEALLLRERAETAIRDKMRFLGNIGHELRTPLQAIVGYVEIIDMGIHGPVTDAQREDLRRIRTSQRHILALVDDVLEFLRSGTAARLQQFVDVSLSEAVAEAFALVEPLMAPKQLAYRREPSDAQLTAWADGDSLRQILVNLLANAVKFTPRGGQIATGWTSTADTVRINVSDTGIGIPKDKLEAIFDPFVQLNASTNVASGAGLGLAISRDLARAMNGDITVESMLGRGSHFTVVLPRARSDG
jgi:signal transduction histidine kinase